MTVTEMVSYFDLLQDKYGSPYFTTSEKETFLTQAQLGIIADYLPKEGDEQNVEKNANTWLEFSPLFFTMTTAMSGLGSIIKADINASITSSLGFSATILRPLSITWTDSEGTRPIMGPTRQNNWAKYQNNVFKVPIAKEPRYYETNTSYIINPVDVTAIITVNGLRYPRAISVSGAQDAELESIYHNEIVSRALEAAGVGSRDEMLAQLQKINKI